MTHDSRQMHQCNITITSYSMTTVHVYISLNLHLYTTLSTTISNVLFASVEIRLWRWIGKWHRSYGQPKTVITLCLLQVWSHACMSCSHCCPLLQLSWCTSVFLCPYFIVFTKVSHSLYTSSHMI